jgi:hypothetical protein
LTNDTKGSELAINIADKNLFFKDSTGVVNTVPIRQSGASSNGWLSSTDWNTFNNKQPAGTYVTSVGATAPVASSGGTTPTISMPAATTSVSGYLTNTDWNTFNNKANAFTYTTNYIPYGQGTATPTQSVGLQYNGTTFTTTGISTSNNLAFTGTGNRILGDFSNATVTSRVAFQTSTTNGNTVVQALPNGTSDISSFRALDNTDPTNARFIELRTSSSQGDARIVSFANGSGTALPMTFYTGGNERARIPTAGGLQVVNCVSVGNATPAASGAGITFPATQSASSDANTLDDYEEGTWTPGVFAYGPGGTLPTFTGFASSGKYTKIGRQVFLTGVISWTGTSGGATFFAVDGLPFSIDAHNMQASMEFDTGFQASLGVAEAIWDAGLKPRSFTGASEARFKFGYASSGGTNVVVDLSCTALLNTTANLRFALTYIV